MNPPVRVALTGAAGQISYALAFRIASGEMLGSDQPVILHMLEIPAAMPALQGVVMELNDCAYPLLKSVVATDDPTVAFRDVEFAYLVGARPRGKGMERGDLLTENGKIFGPQGKALNDYADPRVRVLVVGNPANTNALIALKNAPNLEPTQFTAMTRLDHNRAISQLAEKTGASIADIQRVMIWGNHSATQYPDINHAVVSGQRANKLVDEEWIRSTFIPKVQKRGAEIIEARGLSSAASAAYAALSHMRDWVSGSNDGDWISMAIPSDGSYGIQEGLIYSYPVTVAHGNYEIVRDLEIDDFSRNRMDITLAELEEERDAVKHLFLS